MGFGFRKSIKLGKGTRLNLSKSGLGISTGAKGFRVSTGPRGSRVTAGIPGTGIYYTKSLNGRKKKRTSSSNDSSSSLILMAIIFVILAVVFIPGKIMFFLIIFLAICFIFIFSSNSTKGKELSDISNTDTFENCDIVDKVFNEKDDFYFKNLEELKKYECSLVEESKNMYELAKENIELAIVQGNHFFEIVDEFKKFCESKGEKGTKYFNEMWFSSNDNKSFIGIRREFLDNLIENKIELQDKINLKKKKELLLKNINEKLLEKIKTNDGILQKDILLSFDPDIKYNVAKVIISLEKAGKITRVKKGNTYQLFINN